MLRAPHPPSSLQLHMNGYCRSVLWPILHSTAPSSAYSVQAHESCGEVSTAEWAAGVPMTEELMYAAYDHVCQLFADMARDVAGPNDMLFVHDYELMLVPGKIRAMVCVCAVARWRP
ncbi:hypothetical protein EON66_06740 [archaeon]|nr:MAG: hypothetical protein EON66_06740 [archaeon]